jgi:AmmeMemoRadiSam system protein B/AmmeMemoRadiSam system protein A
MKKFYILLIVLLLSACKQQTSIIREPAVAGSWYPGTDAELSSTISSYFNAVNTTVDGTVQALIVPHAGWAYSGLVAASAFKQLHGRNFSTVMVIGPSHHEAFSGVAIPNATHFKTPLGLVRISPKIKTLLLDKNFRIDNVAHQPEHSIEIELPFLQKTLGDFELIPLLVGYQTDLKELKQIAESLKKVFNDKTLIVISSDFTHFGKNYGYVPFTNNLKDNLKQLDSRAVSFIENFDASGFYDYVDKTGDTICGARPITILLQMIQNSSLEVKELAYDTSGRMINDYTNSVSYESIVFYTKNGLTDKDKKYLATLARQTLDMYVSSGEVPVINADSLDKSLTRTQGCFVTLNENGNLRGCIGHIIPQVPLYKCIIENAVNAAVHDMRFTPVKPEELKDIEVEVSVLSIPSQLNFNSSDELLNGLRPNVDGVVLDYNGRQSTFLPQVWEQVPQKENFLAQLCLKQGSIADCWKDSSLKVYTYTADVFHE